MTHPAPPATPPAGPPAGPPAEPRATPPGRPAPQAALARVLWDVLAVLGERTRPAGTTPVIPRALAALIAARLLRLQVRFVTLVEKALAGTLAPVRPRRSRAAPTDAPRRAYAKNPLPRAPGWLARLCPSGWITQRPIAPALNGLARLLEDATVQELLASDPRFGRALRPLWRMLWTEPPPPCLRLPPRPRTPRAPHAKTHSTTGIGQPIPRGVTRRDLEFSRACAAAPSPTEAAAAAASPPAPPTPWRTATDWTPTHLTLHRRWSVLAPIAPGRRRDAGGCHPAFAVGDGT